MTRGWLEAGGGAGPGGGAPSAALIVISISCLGATSAAAHTNNESLYNRLGGKPAIRAVVEKLQGKSPFQE